MNGIIRLVTPLLLHMFVSELTVILAGSRMDAAMCTTVSSLIVLPAGIWMLYSDKKRSSTEMTDDTIQDAGNRRKILFWVLCFVGGGILNLVWSGIMNLLHITQSFSNQAQEALFAGQILIQFLGLGLLVPAAEELIFRGLIYRRMRQWFPVQVSALLSALLFAVYHGNPIQMIYAFPMAVVLAVIMEKGKHLVFAVLFHMGANLTAVMINMFMSL